MAKLGMKSGQLTQQLLAKHKFKLLVLLGQFLDSIVLFDSLPKILKSRKNHGLNFLKVEWLDDNVADFAAVNRLDHGLRIDLTS